MELADLDLAVQFAAPERQKRDRRPGMTDVAETSRHAGTLPLKSAEAPSTQQRARERERQYLRGGRQGLSPKRVPLPNRTINRGAVPGAASVRSGKTAGISRGSINRRPGNPRVYRAK